MDSKVLIACITDPIAIQLATSTENLMPRTVRGFGARFDEEEGTLTIGVTDAQSEAFLMALRKSMIVAANLAHPISMRGIQVKGPVLAIEEVSTDATQAAAEYWQRFQGVIMTIGFKPEETRAMFHSGGARWIKIRPLEMFNQTPGKAAGSRI